MPLFYRLQSLVRAGALEAAGITAIPETTMTQDAPHHLRLLFIYTGLDTWILQLFFFLLNIFFPLHGGSAAFAPRIPAPGQSQGHWGRGSPHPQFMGDFKPLLAAPAAPQDSSEPHAEQPHAGAV